MINDSVALVVGVVLLVLAVFVMSRRLSGKISHQFMPYPRHNWSDGKTLHVFLPGSDQPKDDISTDKLVFTLSGKPYLIVTVSYIGKVLEQELSQSQYSQVSILAGKTEGELETAKYFARKLENNYPEIDVWKVGF